MLYPAELPRPVDGGRGGIRTHGRRDRLGFQDRCLRPLGHPSGSNPAPDHVDRCAGSAVTIYHESVLQSIRPNRPSDPLELRCGKHPSVEPGKGVFHGRKRQRLAREDRVLELSQPLHRTVVLAEDAFDSRSPPRSMMICDPGRPVTAEERDERVRSRRPVLSCRR